MTENIEKPAFCESLFYAFIHKLIARTELILANPRMAATPIPIVNGTSFSGEMRQACVGDYLTWWRGSELSRDIVGNPVWKLQGGMTDHACMAVGEDGKAYRATLNAPFVTVARDFAESHRNKPIADVQDPFTLQQLITQLRPFDMSNTEEIKPMSFEEFQATVRALNKGIGIEDYLALAIYIGNLPENIEYHSRDIVKVNGFGWINEDIPELTDIGVVVEGPKSMKECYDEYKRLFKRWVKSGKSAKSFYEEPDSCNDFSDGLDYVVNT